ncbi:MAG TPA: Spx/MgsR family RNA polymerase-binding regulatory protein [Ferruginibacter sp.]|nr:Spx/MgsR family RNA polymerase-binding regulatory protein [Ferruginibacter sp.]HMP20611.1 Spx/MgsR family RNA polymerase-binding regulatory protein [Ferruginibacter sp.]
MASVQLYGLPYCDSTKAVTKWLAEKGIPTQLHNYKTDGISREKLEQWCSRLGWEKILNKRSTTWRSLKKEEQDSITSEAAAIAIMIKNTSLIKRPLIEFGKELLAGFDEKQLTNTFK